jgi:hypothetical protein
VVYADSDMFLLRPHREVLPAAGRWPAGAGWQRENMSKNRLAIVPDQTHYDLFVVHRSSSKTVMHVLDGKSSRRNAWKIAPSGIAAPIALQ